MTIEQTLFLAFVFLYQTLKVVIVTDLIQCKNNLYISYSNNRENFRFHP